MSDLTPLSLGIGALKKFDDGSHEKEKHLNVIIKRNSTIPFSMKKIYSTTKDDQTKVEVEVLQGEKYFAKDNHKIGVFTMEGIPKQPAGQ